VKEAESAEFFGREDADKLLSGELVGCCRYGNFQFLKCPPRLCADGVDVGFPQTRHRLRPEMVNPLEKLPYAIRACKDDSVIEVQTAKGAVAIGPSVRFGDGDGREIDDGGTLIFEDQPELARLGSRTRDEDRLSRKEFLRSGG